MTTHDNLWGFLKPHSPTLSRIDLLKSQMQYNIGRNIDTNHVAISDLLISNSHCIITWDGRDTTLGHVSLTDLSTNGTFVNGERVGQNSCRTLRHGDEVALISPLPDHQSNIGDYRFVFYRIIKGMPVSSVHANYDVGTILGQGGFATVRRAVHRITGVSRAIKMISAVEVSKRPEGGDRDRRADFLREISIMQKLDHRNICKLVETYFELDGGLSLVLELAEGGDLLKYVLRTSRGVDESPAREITQQVCSALAYIHGRGIAHRDLKLENILLAAEAPLIVKVSDFGLAIEANGPRRLHTMCGTPCYVAPEVMTDMRGYTNLADSWSMGVIVFSLLTRQFPFLDDHNELLQFNAKQRSVEWEILRETNRPLSEQAVDFIKCLLKEDPECRLSLTAALKHPWVVGGNRPNSRLRCEDDEPTVDIQVGNLQEDDMARSTSRKPKAEGLEDGLKEQAKDQTSLSKFQPVFSTQLDPLTQPGVNASGRTGAQPTGARRPKSTTRPMQRELRKRANAGRLTPVDEEDETERAPYTGVITRARKKRTSQFQSSRAVAEDKPRRSARQAKKAKSTVQQ